MLSNWHRATEGRMVDRLVLIGVAFGADFAFAMYRDLRDEPRDDCGERVDWLVIQRKIEQASSALPIRGNGKIRAGLQV